MCVCVCVCMCVCVCTLAISTRTELEFTCLSSFVALLCLTSLDSTELNTGSSVGRAFSYQTNSCSAPTGQHSHTHAVLSGHCNYFVGSTVVYVFTVSQCMNLQITLKLTRLLLNNSTYRFVGLRSE